jgi:hypothetical protein
MGGHPKAGSLFDAGCAGVGAVEKSLVPFSYMPTPKEESTQLMNELFSFAKRMLEEHQEFYPYGGYIDIDGKITHVAGKIEGTDHPRSQPIIDLLTKNFQEEARKGKYRATAIIFDVRIKPPGAEEKTDAIQICLDHREDYSIEVLFPYKIVDGDLLFGKTFAQKGNRGIFARKG